MATTSSSENPQLRIKMATDSPCSRAFRNNGPDSRMQETSSHISTDEAQTAHHEIDEIRRGVSLQEKMLLSGILVVVAAWILFRIVLHFLTSDLPLPQDTVTLDLQDVLPAAGSALWRLQVAREG